jgi:diguanylate cyclase (GGDEF)-like protein
LHGIAEQLELHFNQGHPVVLGQHCHIDDLVKSGNHQWTQTLAIEIHYEIENLNINCDLLLLFTEDSVAKINQQVDNLLDSGSDIRSSTESLEFTEMHWLMDVLHNIDFGLVILDREYKIQLWNGFMENHSGLRPDEVHDKALFDSFPDIPEPWFRQKAEPVFELKTRTFTIWEQRPYVFKFKNYRPITGRAPHMFQNSSIIPLESIDGSVKHICLIIYDVTDVAMNREDLSAANKNLNHLSKTDGLTELLSNSFWQEEFSREYKRGMRSKHASTLVLFEIDNFDSINSKYSHQVGDDVLRAVASLLKQTVRETDISGRLSDKQFAILLVDTNAKSAINLAERLRKKIMEIIINSEQSEIKFTISSGVAEIHADFSDELKWSSAAEKALRHAQKSGMNKTTVYQTKPS